VAVTVQLPAVLSRTLKVPMPPLKAALAGKLALGSLAVMATVSPAVGTTFQLSSTALAVTSNGVSVFCAVAVPVLPVKVPGAADSPGTSNCSFANAPGLTVKESAGAGGNAGLVTSAAVTVQLPAVLLVKLKVPLPALRAALAANWRWRRWR